MSHPQHAKNIGVAIIGATGMIGQVFAAMLSNHPWFRVRVLCASPEKAGRQYGESLKHRVPLDIHRDILQMKLSPLDCQGLKSRGVRVVFSALPSASARTIEEELRTSGFLVFSNAGAFRRDTEVPILVPEANPLDLTLALEQMKKYRGGAIITNANCSTTGLAVALAPLRRLGDIREVWVSTYQSLSGAGYPGLSAMDTLDNAIPFISGEEEKIRVELQKILHIQCRIHPFCARIPVLYGHLETLWIRFRHPVNPGELVKSWEDLSTEGEKSEGPSFPHKPVEYLSRREFPQNRLAFHGRPPGMTVYTGRLRQEENLTGLVLMVNNLVKGGAGGSVQNAELFLRYYGDRL